MKVKLKKVRSPQRVDTKPIELTDETIKYRKEKVLGAMKNAQIDKLVIYGDVEHGSNFEYLVGYFTRFEEALLVLNQNGEATLLLGNENLNKASKSRIKANSIHVSLLSLPNQPNRKDKTLQECLIEAGINKDDKVGIVGWKMFTTKIENKEDLYDVPYYIVKAIKNIVNDDSKIVSASKLFIGENGVRETNNANEIAHYEYGASLASNCVFDAMELIDEGISELELGDKLVRYGQHTSIVTIASSGPRFVRGNMFPLDRKVKLGDPVSLTVGYRGGSSSRAGYAVRTTDDLSGTCKKYLEELVFPYFKAYACWLENVKIGKKGREIFELIDKVLPRKIYRWSLCPGHLTAEEEWMSSPIYEGSTESLRSGMMFQIDLIPSKEGMAGTSCESTVVLADEKLKKEIEKEYPEMWKRMQNRILYIKNELGINISDDILPMCDTVAYLRPYLLNKECACVIERSE